MKTLDIQEQIEQLPQLISLTELRYETKKLKRWLSEAKPVVLTERGKKLGLITPVDKKPFKKFLPMPPAYNLGKILFKKRADIYKSYLGHKMNEE